MLIIEARREHKANPDYRPSGWGWKNRQSIDYTSACLITRHKHEFTYGKFEMRARIDTRLGSWPAFWTLGISRGWPACGEIDIMEYYTGKVLANVCYGRRGQQVWTDTRKPLADLGGDAWAKQFHIWTMEWDKQRIDLLLDGKLMTHFAIADDNDAAKSAFHQPHYILLNQAIGGTQGGDPAKTKFPVQMEVDWVRVYQKTAASK
jgi:beta-glucanase (GH16 family)